MIISVILVAMTPVKIIQSSISMTHCGMAKDVLLLAAAVSFSLPQMTWKLDCVIFFLKVDGDKIITLIKIYVQ